VLRYPPGKEKKKKKEKKDSPCSLASISSFKQERYVSRSVVELG
jgi:hypothetical protein